MNDIELDSKSQLLQDLAKGDGAALNRDLEKIPKTEWIDVLHQVADEYKQRAVGHPELPAVDIFAGHTLPNNTIDPDKVSISVVYTAPHAFGRPILEKTVDIQSGKDVVTPFCVPQCDWVTGPGGDGHQK
jgi:hypothetical protein